MGLSTGVNKDERHTFFHHAWSSSSQIDYILVNDKNLISKYNIDEKSSINLSAHTSGTVKTTIEIPANTKPANKNKKAKFNLQWDKMDKRQYNNLIQQDSISIIVENNVNTQMDMVTNSLIRAGNITIPKNYCSWRGPKWKASPEVQILLRSCRDLYKQWQEVGKQKDHPMATTLRNEKRKLRSKIRMEQAVSRQNLYQQIMDNPNSQLFYRLINRNRSNQRTSTKCLKIDEAYNFVPEEQRKSFAKYYEDLSVPKENIYENGYLNLCKIRQQLYEQAMDKESEDPEQFTETEVMKAIGKLNTKKTFDVVQHIILMDKALDQNIHPTYWKILTELYEGLSSKVKWMDVLSEPFKIKQGVRQGGTLSTHLYKIFVQDLLVELEQNSLG
ncbi:unnamed protein product [Mytilus coruscus]|uniref:Uncharacterized protein n=1 Tax=Mytilus coruscus TaxID=42192 RepID=A0A6J8ESQ2_MYTCO|nr:unnamed protein product [Mytilus coruscus]